MKRSMDEYKISMDNILPSENFLSETEALMKKIRDENASKETYETERINKAEDIRIDVRTNIRTERIKKWTIGLSAAAAAVVCVFAAGTSRSMDVKESMVTESPSEMVSESVYDTDVTQAEMFAEEAAETTFAVIEEAEEEREDAVEPISEAETPASDSKKDKNKEEKKKTQQKDKDKSREEAPAGGDLKTANSMTGELPIVVKGGADEDAAVIIEAPVYDDGAETTENVGLLSDDVPVYYPYYEEIEEEDIDDDESFEGSGYGDPAPVQSKSAPVVFFALSESDEGYFGTEDIYVPDSISEMEDGGYYLVIDAGFDRYSVSDSENVLLVGAASKEIRDETEASDLLSSIAAISGECTAVFSEKEQVMTNYRYSVKVCSSEEGDRDAELFEIRFDSKVLQINRYDNGTVSSEIYYISESEYNELNRLIGKVM